MMWSWDTFRIDRIVDRLAAQHEQNPGYRVLYYFADGPQRAFLREELQEVPEDAVSYTHLTLPTILLV